MLTLYDNPFSPFARKVRLVLDFKGIECEVLDGLTNTNKEKLAAVNRRVEVPALDHDGLIVVNSADIVAYLERVFPEPAVYPADHAAYVTARAWERCSDTTIDAILVDISLWLWADRDDERPESLLAAARTDMGTIYQRLETQLVESGGPWICGEQPSIADFALFPQLSGTRMLGVPMDKAKHPQLLGWYKRCRQTAPFSDDLARAMAYVSDPSRLGDLERKKIFWRGDRIEWFFTSGHHEWFMNEVREDRVLWPGLGVP